MWPFTPKPKAVPGKKLSLIAVKDYPKEAYSAYWEIFIAPDFQSWWVNLIDFKTSETLDTGAGTSTNEEEARRLSQSWVLERIENYRRRVV